MIYLLTKNQDNMKKIYIILFVIFFTNSYTFANCSECKIKDWTPEILENYFSDLDKVIWNISSINWDTEKNTWIPNDFIWISKKVTSVYNEWVDWDWYMSYFDFYVVYATMSEYVPEVWRDYEKINKYSKRLEYLLKISINRWYKDKKISKDEVCKWVKNECNFNWDDIYTVIWQVLNNNESLKDYYRLSITWKKNYFDKDKLKNLQLFDKNTFVNEFNKYYNEFTSKNCSSCEEWFDDRIKTRVESISNWQDLWKNGTKDWIYRAWLLRWDTYVNNLRKEEIERKILQKELWRQWLSTSTSEKMLKNLEKFNDSWWFSPDNNFLTNTVSYVVDRSTAQYKEFDETVLSWFKNIKEREIPLSKFDKIDKWVLSQMDIENEIAELYNQELEFVKMTDDTVEALEWRIIEMHINLTYTIDALQNIFPLAEKVCNDQWTDIPSYCETWN